jgi:hypothetical protein
MEDILKTHGYSLSPWKISPSTKSVLDWLKKKKLKYWLELMTLVNEVKLKFLSQNN